MLLKRGDKKSLWDYIKKFKKGVAPIKELKMQDAVGHFTRNLNVLANKDFMKDVITKGPQTLGEVYKIAQEHISVEEAFGHCTLARIRIMNRVEIEMKKKTGTKRMENILTGKRGKLGEMGKLLEEE